MKTLKDLDNALKSALFDNFIRTAQDTFEFLKYKDIKNLSDTDLRCLASFTIGYFGLMEQ